MSNNKLLALLFAHASDAQKKGELALDPFLRRAGRFVVLSFDFCLRTSIPVLTTSTRLVAWPQGDQFLGGGL